MVRLKPHQKRILQALQDSGGQNSVKQIALLTGLHANGVSQTMGALAARGLVAYLDGKGSASVYVLKTQG